MSTATPSFYVIRLRRPGYKPVALRVHDTLDLAMSDKSGGDSRGVLGVYLEACPECGQESEHLWSCAMGRESDSRHIKAKA